MKVIVIEPNGYTVPKFVEIDGSLDSFQALVGGYIEQISTNLANCYAYANEEGKLQGLAHNALASHISPLMPSDFIAGNMVLVGPPDENGDETDVDKSVMNDLIAICEMNNARSS